MSSVITFGKFKGLPVAEVPYWYLRWMVHEKHSKVAVAEEELQRRVTLQKSISVEPAVLERLKQSQNQSWRRTRRPREAFRPWLDRLASAALRNSPQQGGRYTLPGFVFVFDEDGALPKLVDVVPKRHYVP